MVEKVLVIRIKGVVKTDKEIKDTLYLLRLRKTMTAAIYDKNPSILGMIKKVEPWVAWGEINKETFKLLLLKRGRLKGNKRITEKYIKEKTGLSIEEFIEKYFNNEIKLEDLGIKPFFRLKPPSKGFPRKGIKMPYNLGGAYGYYGKDINDLLLRMI